MLSETGYGAPLLDLWMRSLPFVESLLASHMDSSSNVS